MSLFKPAPVINPGGYRETLRMAYPLIISTGSFSVMQFADRVFLARHSAVSIQAALPAGLLSFTMVCTFMAMAGYANTFVAQYFGSGDSRGCSRSTAQGVWLSLFTLPLILLLIPLGRWLLASSGHAPDVLAQELDYFTILMLGGVTIPLNAAISSFFTGRGDTLTNMFAQVAGNVVNIALDYALIFGRWGFPEMGIRGAAIGTVVAGFAPLAILFALYFSGKNNAAYQTRAAFGLDRALMARLIRFGLPSGLHLLLDVASFSAFVLMTGRMGALSLAVSNIALSINTLAFMPLMGISIAASTLVGQYQGRRDSETAEKAGWSALRIGLFYMTGMAITYLLLPRLYFTLFAASAGDGFSLDELVGLGRYLLIMMATWGLLDSVNLILSGALKGAGDTRFVMWYSTAGAWGLLVPGEWWIIYVMKGGILLAWGWLTFVIMILSVGFWWRFKKGSWKSIQVLEHQEPVPPARTGLEAVVMPE